MSYIEIVAPTTPRPASRQCVTSALADLVAEIEAACGGPDAAMGDRIVAALRAAAACPTLLMPDQHAGRPGRYTRHVLYGDPAGRFTILSLVWNQGQFSPPHAHQTWCAYGVHAGTLTETVYALEGAAMTARPLRAAARHAGYCRFEQAGLDHVHRLGNAGPAPAISIHAYGVGRERVETDVNRLVEVAHE
jgi:predicted metal-dependent enzyme (double-stranded beta helix superfamily)